MTTEEIEALQLGDIIQFPDLKYAEVKSINNVDKNISLRMLSGDHTDAVGDVPPEMIDMDTLCVCPWADLSAAIFISNAPALAQGRVIQPESLFVGKIEPRAIPPPGRIKPKRGLVFPETYVIPEPFTPQPREIDDGELVEEGTVQPIPIEEGEAFSGEIPDITPPTP